LFSPSPPEGEGRGEGEVGISEIVFAYDPF